MKRPLRLEYRLQKFAIPHLTLALIVGQVAVWLFWQMDSIKLEQLALQGSLLKSGEVWRTFTFMFLPPDKSIVWIAFAWYMFYVFGTALENFIGTLRYNLYLGVSWLALAAASLTLPDQMIGNGMILTSVFLAFAYLNPNFEVLIFFILPVRIKWLAALTWFGYGVVVLFLAWQLKLMVLAANLGFVLFFGRDVVTRIRLRRRSMQWTARSWSEQGKSARQPFHQCAVCGKTDLSHPDLDFRYCAECGGLGYCPEHIGAHEHRRPSPVAR